MLCVVTSTGRTEEERDLLPFVPATYSWVPNACVVRLLAGANPPHGDDAAMKDSTADNNDGLGFLMLVWFCIAESMHVPDPEMECFCSNRRPSSRRRRSSSRGAAARRGAL